MACALKNIISNEHFRRRISVEEQGARKHDGFQRGIQIVYMIYDHFRAIGAYDAAQDLSDLFNVSLHGADIQDFDTRWDPSLSSACEKPTDNVLESLYKMKIRESVQLQTV